MFEEVIAGAAARYDVPQSWIRAVIDVESAWDPDAVNPADPAFGLMQLIEPTARGLGFTGSLEELMIPEINIDLGSRLLGQLRESYGDDFRAVYSAYNSGNPDAWTFSEQVAANVGRAVDALSQYRSTMGAGAVVLLLIVAMIALRKGDA